MYVMYVYMYLEIDKYSLSLLASAELEQLSLVLQRQTIKLDK